MAKTRSDVAYAGAIHRTIPKKHTDISVTAANGTLDLRPFAGMWIWLRASGADVTLRLGSSIANTGEGFVVGVDDAAPQEFYIDPDDDLVLNHRASGAATLRILHD